MRKIAMMISTIKKLSKSQRMAESMNIVKVQETNLIPHLLAVQDHLHLQVMTQSSS